MARILKPPASLGTSGRHLWTSCLRRDDDLAESDNPLRDVLLNACRLADHIETMQRTLETDGLQVFTDQGQKAHPMLSEMNKAMSLQARLIVSLRLPEEASGKRPQRRGATSPRSAQVPGGRKASSSVSSLDRARRHAVGA